MTVLPLPPKPTFDPNRPAPYFVAAAKIYNAWRRRGVGNAFAIGMGVTQADMESAFKPGAVGDHGQAYSIYQWHWNPRGLAIRGATGVDVRTETDFDKLVEAAWWELNNTEKVAHAKISAAATAAEAAMAACTYFEGAGAQNAAARRAQDAQFWVVFFSRNLDWAIAQG